MNEVVGTFIVKKIWATFFIISKPIDAVWATTYIVVVGACLTTAGYGVGDHRLFILEFLTYYLIWQTQPRIIRSSARKLNTKITSTKDNYTNVLENQVVTHGLTEQIVAAHNTSSSIVLLKERIDIIDQEGVQYIHHAERICRRIKYGCIPLSTYSSIWIRHCQVYCFILCYHAGKIRNQSNLKRSAWRYGIGGPL